MGGIFVKQFKKLKKKKKIIIIVLILLFIIFMVKRNADAQKASLEEQKIQTETIEKRTIAKSVSATGTVTTENSKEIVAGLTGSKIATVNVVEGQKIAVGDVICTFDMASTKNSLSNAQSSANISDAQSNLGIESARRNLNEAVKSRDSQIVNAQKEVASAQEAYTNAQNQLSTLNATLTTKQTELATLDTTYTETQNALSAMPATQPDAITLTEKLTTLQTQKEALSTEIQQLQATIAEMQLSVNNLKMAFDASVSTLDATSSAADSNVAAMQDNLSNAELSAQSSNIAQKGQLETYEEQLKQGIVTSTVAGTVTSVFVKEGDLYTGTTIASVNEIDEFVIEAQINEYDIADIQKGMKALIKTDATKEEELEGQVTYVAMTPTEQTLSAATATSTSNNATYKIKIALNEQNERLRLGMNAKISIILESKENVWTIPYDAIYKREDGTNYIEILKNEETEETEELEVEVGIEGTYYVEIIASQLKEGMQVVLPKQDAGTSIQDLIQMEGPNAGI